MASQVCQKVIELISPILDGLGIELADIEYVKKNNGMNLTVFITKPDGIMVEDCERVHRAINDPLDELDPTNGSPYILNVSSLGLDRPFKTMRDYERNIGKEVDIKLYTPIDGKKLYVGILQSINNEELILNVLGKDIIIKKDKIAVTTPHINF